MQALNVRAQALRQGFTLIEVMIVVAIIAILAAIALPSYERYIRQSKAKSAAADLVALSLALENRFQKQLAYPVYTQQNIPASVAARKGSTLEADFALWVPSQGADFAYSITSTISGYTLTAKNTGDKTWCTLVLSERNERDLSSCSVLSQW